MSWKKLNGRGQLEWERDHLGVSRYWEACGGTTCQVAGMLGGIGCCTSTRPGAYLCQASSRRPASLFGVQDLVPAAGTIPTRNKREGSRQGQRSEAQPGAGLATRGTALARAGTDQG